MMWRGAVVLLCAAVALVAVHRSVSAGHSVALEGTDRTSPLLAAVQSLASVPKSAAQVSRMRADLNRLARDIDAADSRSSDLARHNEDLRTEKGVHHEAGNTGADVFLVRHSPAGALRRLDHKTGSLLDHWLGSARSRRTRNGISDMSRRATQTRLRDEIAFGICSTRALARVHQERRQAGREHLSFPLFVPQYMRGTPEEKRRAEARLQRKHRAVREDATDGERQHRERLSARDELREAEARLRRENEDRQVLQREETRREGADTVSGRGGRRMRELRTDDARVKRGRRERDVTRGGDTDAIEKMTKAAERKAEARVQDFFTRKADALQRLYRKEQLELEYQAQYLRMARGTASASPSGLRNHQHDDGGRRAADWQMEEQRRMQRAITGAEEVRHAAVAGGEEQGVEGNKGSEEARQESIPRDAKRRPSFRARYLPNAARHHWAASTEREVQRVDAARAQPHEYGYSSPLAISHSQQKLTESPLDAAALSTSPSPQKNTLTWPTAPRRHPQGAYKDNTVYDSDYSWPSASEVVEGDEWQRRGDCGMFGSNC